MSDLRFDKKCVPFPGKRIYWIINIPYLLLLIVTAVYLWQFSILISSIYISLYMVSIILHGYVCAFSGCPYKGRMCPGAFAYFPVGKMAMLYASIITDTPTEAYIFGEKGCIRINRRWHEATSVTLMLNSSNLLVIIHLRFFSITTYLTFILMSPQLSPDT